MSALLLLLIGCEAEPEAIDSADACAQAGIDAIRTDVEMGL